nr:MAG TPA: hypothetical protein [Caudoviricetes sp.]
MRRVTPSSLSSYRVSPHCVKGHSTQARTLGVNQYTSGVFIFSVVFNKHDS